MKNPCEQCLVSPACTALCPAKINYGTLIEGGVLRYGEYLRDPHIRFIQRTKAIYKYYKDKSYNHSSDIIKITTRSKGLL